jgi:hypothetical protein
MRLGIALSFDVLCVESEEEENEKGSKHVDSDDEPGEVFQ